MNEPILLVVIPLLGLFVWYCLRAPAEVPPTEPPQFPPTLPPHDAAVPGRGATESPTTANAVPARQDTYRLASDAGASSLPSGTYLGWPIPVCLALLVLGLLSAGAGSGGTPEGFAVAWLLNPINWGMAYTLFQIGKMKCPHCRRTARLGEARNAPVASPLTCPHCSNAIAKPRG